jgi:iron complex transport system substrate-binding protein
LILDSERHDRPGIGQGIMGHPALRRLAAAAPPIAFPIKWWLCSSPASADAIDALAETVNGIGKRP